MEYYYRESLYNLVELALLARAYEESLVGALPKEASLRADFHLEGTAASRNISFQQTLLKMKATEGHGRLVVAIHGSDPVGFYWTPQGAQMVMWVRADHRGQGVEAGLLKWAQQDENASV